VGLIDRYTIEVLVLIDICTVEVVGLIDRCGGYGGKKV
jgi:hypothetical protein